MTDRPQVMIPNMCQKHQSLLVHQAQYKESDPWRALILASQIVLFQATTAHPQTAEKIGGDITRIGELGCLACFRPDVFGEIVEAAKSHDIGAIKAVGDRWVFGAAKPAEPQA